MVKFIITNIFVFFFCFSWSQTENSWTKKSSFGGLKREKAVAFSIGDFGYVATGVDTAEITHNDLWQYDPALDSWSQKASMPAVERRNAVGFSIANKGYIGTGFDLDDGSLGTKLKDFWQYDPSLNAWESIADYPGGGDTGVYQATAFAIGAKGYVACGKIGSDAYISELWEYNPETDTWTERTPFPGGDRYQLVSFVVENKAYVGLGTDHDIYRRDFYEYSPLSNTWETKADFPGTERSKASTFSIGVNGYVVFGADGGLKNELWEYGYYTQNWHIRAPFPTDGRSNGIAFTINNRGYAGLGKGSTGKKRSFYEYTPVGPLSITKNTVVSITAYPNPFASYMHIVLAETINKGSYLIYSSQGQIIRENTFNSHQFTIERGELANGYYQLAILDSEGNLVGIKKISLL